MNSKSFARASEVDDDDAEGGIVAAEVSCSLALTGAGSTRRAGIPSLLPSEGVRPLFLHTLAAEPWTLEDLLHTNGRHKALFTSN